MPLCSKLFIISLLSLISTTLCGADLDAHARALSYCEHVSTLLRTGAHQKLFTETLRLESSEHKKNLEEALFYREYAEKIGAIKDVKIIGVKTLGQQAAIVWCMAIHEQSTIFWKLDLIRAGDKWKPADWRWHRNAAGLVPLEYFK